MRGGRACERERATQEEAAQGDHSAATVTVTVYPLHLLFRIYMHTYIPHSNGDGTTAAATAAESQALHSYIKCVHYRC